MFRRLLVISGPRVPPKVGSFALGANCVSASQTSRRSLQRCTNASICANMDDSSKRSQDLPVPRLTASTVALYTFFHASPDLMDSRSACMQLSTTPSSKISLRSIFAQQRLMISLDTFRRSPVSRSGVL